MQTPLSSFKQMLERAMPSISAVLPRHLTPERVAKIATLAVSRSPLLLECTPTSIVQTVIISSQLGLEMGGPLGHAYPVPYWNSKLNGGNGGRECQFVIGYKGIIELARRSGEVQSIEARIVREGDVFEYEITDAGTRLRHVPKLDGELGAWRLVYSIARLTGDTLPQIELMSRAQVLAIRDRVQRNARRKDEGPWFTDEEEMARKTVVKRLAKFLPLSVEKAGDFRAAVELDNRADGGENDISGLGFEAAEVVATEAAPPPPPPTRGAAGLKAAVSKQAPPAPTSAPEAQIEPEPEAAAVGLAPAAGGPTEDEINRAECVRQITARLAVLSKGKKDAEAYKSACLSSWSDGWHKSETELGDATPALLQQILTRALES
ncbi:MAG: recombinase RecT [Candidatus Eisenbacteria bacterium]|nr:recombinase RecT [Candidatus Eisenbacteria bacterium]